MKIIITLLTLFLLLPVASASDSIDITDKSEIKYKWYKIEKEDGIYYEKGKNLEGYIEDKNNYKVSYNYTIWSQSNCYDSRENFVIESKQTYIYESVIKIKYILLEDIEEKDIKEISIYSGNKKIEHKIISTSDKKIKIDLQSLYYVDDLWMYIDSTKPYKILTSPNESFALLALSKNVENTKILLPDKTWITNKTVYNTEYNDAFRHKTDFIKSIHVKGKIVQSPLVISYRRISITVELSKRINIIPNIFVIGMKNMSPVQVDIYIFNFLGINITSDMRSFFDYKTFFSSLSSLMCKSSIKKPCANK